MLVQLASVPYCISVPIQVTMNVSSVVELDWTAILHPNEMDFENMIAKREAANAGVANFLLRQHGTYVLVTRVLAIRPCDMHCHMVYMWQDTTYF